MRKILYILLTLPLFTFGQAQDSCYSITDFMSQTETVNPAITKNFTAGWNMFGYPCAQSLDLVEALSSIIDKVIIVKNNNGSVYMPEFGFNGIGYLESGEGYQIKLSDTEYGFSFCESINWPDLEGCTDCEAINFDPFAVTDNGTCEVIGCLNNTACNYNPDANIADGNCEFSEQGYDCDGICFDLDTNDICDILQGCTDPIACNYNSEAIYSEPCFYAEYGYNCDSTIYCQYIDPIITDQVIIDSFSTTSPFCKDYTNSRINGIHLMGWGTFADSIQNLYGLYQIESVRSLWLSGLSIISSLEGLNNIESVELIQISNNSNLSDCSAIYPLLSIADSVNIINNAEGCNSVEEIEISYNTGCMDTMACNFDSSKLYHDESFCTYPEQGYDCDGYVIAEIGDEIEGGILFYLDETEQRGLVAAKEDLTEGAFNIDGWGYYGYDFGHCYSSYEKPLGNSIGEGYANTQIQKNCLGYYETNAALAATKYESEGYNDWYLPSIDELKEIYNTIGNGGSIGNIANLAPNPVYLSSSSDGSGNEFGGKYSYYMFPDDGRVYLGLASGRVRPIRAFGYNLGCMNQTSCNFDAEANMNDNSCYMNDLGCGCDTPAALQGFDCEGNIIAEFGEQVQGGALFYIDESGRKGIVSNQSSDWSLEWGCLGDTLYTANSFGIGSGLQNTIDLYNSDCEYQSELTLVDDMINTSQFWYASDSWYLPSIDELSVMGANLNWSNSQTLWSSTQDSTTNQSYALSVQIDGNDTIINHNSMSRDNIAEHVLIKYVGEWNEGCGDSLACNFDPTVELHNSYRCEYPEKGYDCSGNVSEAFIGMEAMGGIVFYLDSTGNHGLVVAKNDASYGATYDGSEGFSIEGFEWGCYGKQISNANGVNIGDGIRNTQSIIENECTTENGGVTAAKAAVDYSHGGYTDWYLPSIYELIEASKTISPCSNNNMMCDRGPDDFGGCILCVLLHFIFGVFSI